jgi:hypothetical protein
MELIIQPKIFQTFPDLVIGVIVTNKRFSRCSETILRR